MAVIRTGNVPSPDPNVPAPMDLRVLIYPPSNQYHSGTTVRCYAKVTAGGQGIAPQGIEFRVTTPRGSEAVYNDVFCDELGSYFVRLSLDEYGVWNVKVSVPGPDKQVAQQAIIVV